MSFPRYPEYKDSGVEWLGEVPAHWDVKRLKHNLRLLTEKTDRRTNPVALENIEGWSGRFIPTETEFEGEGIAFDKGDILFGKLRPYLAKALLAEDAGEAVGDFHVLRPQPGIHARFTQYEILNRSFIDIVDGSTFGSKMPRASWEFVGSMELPTPPHAEQTAIATFLDHETAKIDALVAEQEKLITLLQEKRQAVISHAVTKGLDPNVPMKDSGVEWLGEVPGHWEVKQLRHVANIVRGASPRPAGDPKFFTSEPVVGQTTPWVTVAEITKDAEIYLRDVKEYLTVLGAESSQFFPSGTLVFTNSGATLGVPKVLAIDCCANDGVLAFRDLSTSIDILFAYHFLSTTTDRLRTEMKQGGGQPNLNTDIVKNIGIALPPRDEQDAIVGYLASKNTKFDVLVTEARSAITLLQERRTALISAAVTGQIDVRSTVATEAFMEVA
jgi:type I restriction enzyme S subunit